ncbi:hypothetical protein HOY80DRAFT_962661 [Tuber brumale]|nr:hypothetical protein HOY80DRAFT_962661 [Tuber brumale]
MNQKLRLRGPKVSTNNTLLREAQECETLRREHLALPKNIKAVENMVPFVLL